MLNNTRPGKWRCLQGRQAKNADREPPTAAVAAAEAAASTKDGGARRGCEVAAPPAKTEGVSPRLPQLPFQLPCRLLRIPRACS